MKKSINILLLAFYSFGTFFLPMGDFSTLNDIPEMYQHCKATEDKDMAPLDFITDHLINIDCIFDKHDNGDEQKPHTPIQFHHLQPSNYFLTQTFNVCGSNIKFINVENTIYEENNYNSSFLSFVFRPPIA